MWRNFHEDWERRKAYLIRSLFQDIPLLSPVPENDESRQSSRSPLPEPPQDVAPARPDSPLPPLIIERMPNRHDDPPDFYRELEKKIKKIYRKLFYGEEDEELLNSDDLECSFIDIEMENDDQGADLTATSLPYERDCSDYVTAHEEKTTSQSTSQSKSTSKSLSHNDSDVNNNYLRYSEDDAAISEKSDDTSSTVNADIDDTQITAEVVVHEVNKAIEEEEHIEDVQVCQDDLNKCTSPIIVLKKTRLIQNPIQELHQDIENLSSHNKSDAEQEDEEVSQDESCSNETDLNVSHRSVELMRRQEIISPSLGSLQDDHGETTTSETSRGTEIIGFKRKTSYALHEEEGEFWVQHDAAKEYSLSGEIAHDFYNLAAVMSPIPHFYNNRSSTDSEYVNDVASRSNGDIPVAKRSKYEHVAIQTSTTVEDNETINWDSLKSNFFVGTPKIFKLCSCHNHKCGRH